MKKIHHLTFGNNENHEGFIRFKSSCDRFNIPVINLGKNVEYVDHGMKIIYLREYLKSLDSNDVFLFTDAYDLIYLRDPKEGLLDVFKGFENPVVYSTEQYFHYVLINKFSRWVEHPKSKGYYKLYKYLNSGIIMGTAGYAFNIFNKLDIYENTECDQSVQAKYFFQNRADISLDYNHEISTSSSGREGLEALDFVIQDGMLKNNNTQSFPYIMHFPGENTYSSEVICQMLPFDLPKIKLKNEDKKKYFNARPRKKLLNYLGIDNYEFNLIEISLKYLFILSAIVFLAFVTRNYFGV
jgi:hypothetical protein